MLPDEGIFDVDEVIWVSGSLLAMVFCSRERVGSRLFRRGIIWNWKTGDTVYVGHSLSFEHCLSNHGCTRILGTTQVQRFMV